MSALAVQAQYHARSGRPGSGEPSEHLRVLFIAPYLLSPIRVRPYQWLRGLARRGHCVLLLCPSGAADQHLLGELRGLCEDVVTLPVGRAEVLANCARGLLRGLPLQAAHSCSPALHALLRQILHERSFDVVHVEHLRAAELARSVGAARPGLPLVFDAVDSISLLFERALRRGPSAQTRLMALLDLARTRRYEALYRLRFSQVLVTSQEDHWALEVLRRQHQLPGTGALDVLPNGVDLDYFHPTEASRAPATLVFTGKMSYHANHAAALFLLREIMPLVWQERPDVCVQIVGADPAHSLRAFAGDPRVVVTGYVPDLRPYLTQATLAVSPLRYGVGIQNKVLEAMATATPVIAARQANRALAAQPGRDLLLAESAAEYASAISGLLSDPARRARLGRNGRRYVEQHHNWEQAVARLEQFYRRLSYVR